MSPSHDGGFAALGWGKAIPDSKLSSVALEKRLGLSPGWIKRRTGIAERPIAAPHLATSDLAIQAAEEALAQAGIPHEDLRMVILATSTPDHPLPPTAPTVAFELGLTNVGAIDVAGACSGFLYALSLADSFCRVHGGSALIIGANILSRRLDWEDPATASLFADGAGAVVWGPVNRDAGILGLDLNVDAGDAAQVVVNEGGTRRPYDAGTYARKGHLMTMNAGPRLFRKAVEAMVASGRKALAEAELGIEDIDWWIPHQANARLIQEAGRQLGVPQEKICHHVADIGNSSAATIPVVWSLEAQNQRICPGQRLLLTSVGAGLIAAGCVLKT